MGTEFGWVVAGVEVVGTLGAANDVPTDRDG